VYPDLLYLDNYSWTPPLGVSPQDMAVALLAPTAWIPRPPFCCFLNIDLINQPFQISYLIFELLVVHTAEHRYNNYFSN
jgi:hypothetical protein